MKLKLTRYGHGRESTAGLLFLDDQFFCHTCEDEYRPDKVSGKTRIPNGVYEIKLRDAGGMNERYRERFAFHRGMLHLQDVPDFEWIYLHIGNTHKHTEGCILVGYTGVKSGDEYRIVNSEQAYIDLYQKIVARIDHEQVFINVVSEFQK